MERTDEASNAEVRDLMRRHGLHAEDVADLLGLDLRFMYRWLGDGNPTMPGYLQALLRDRLAARPGGIGGRNR